MAETKEKRSMGSRGGSALLVVLGFLTFMIVSAVSFSVFMRAERKPSGAVRSNLATGFLVKAAMSQAIARLDDALGDDPYPGMTNLNSRVDAKKNTLDFWLGRVFMPPAPEGTTTPGDERSRYANPDDTVPVLTVEALGHLPPPLVNEARYLSRVTQTAKWAPFMHDAGQYAFCAVNVSDYIDVNKVKANAPRGSLENSRISIAHTLRPRTANPSADSFATVNANALKNFDAMRDPSEVPYASLLDFNLAAANAGIDELFSPFGDYVTGTTGPGDPVYKGGVENEWGLAAARQVFATDSWSSPKSGSDNLKHYLSSTDPSEDCQPFTKAIIEKGSENVPFNGNLNRGSEGADASVFHRNYSTDLMPSGYKGRLRNMDMAMLYDYLDYDDVPYSLAMPSVEAVPMVTAIHFPRILLNLGMHKAAAVPDTTGLGGYTRKYYLSSMGEPSLLEIDGDAVNVAFAYPFKVRDFAAAGRMRKYKAQLIMRLLLVVGDDDVEKIPLCRGNSDVFRPEKAEWGSGPYFKKRGARGAANALAFTFASKPEDLNVDQWAATGLSSGDSLDFVRNVEFKFGANQLPNADANVEFIEEKVEVTLAGGGGGGIYESKYKAKTSYTMKLAPSQKDYALAALNDPLVQNFPESAEFTDLNNIPREKAKEFGKFTPYLAAWVRVTDENGDLVVDLAPACPADDKEHDGPNDNTGDLFANASQVAGTPMLAVAFPDCRFTLDGNFLDANFADGDNKQFFPAANAVAKIGNKDAIALMAVDPRFNWQPEDWVARNLGNIGGGQLPEKWLDSIGGLLGADGRDPDIFMATSDCGRLQSLGELAFLPAVGNWCDSDPNNDNQSMNAKDITKLNGMMPYDAVTGDLGIRSRDMVWRTYKSYRGAGEDDLLPDDKVFRYVNPEWNLEIADVDPKAYVSPYTDSPEVMAAALAFTPYDWWAAAKNEPGGADVFDGTVACPATDFARGLPYAFHEGNKNKGACLTFREIMGKPMSERSDPPDEKDEGIAEKIMKAFRDNPDKDWEHVWDNVLDWYGNGNPYDLFGVKLGTPLHSVDRKFLHAYWRGCFANKQQLFLVFVRAEPTALGNAGSKGGRAVALVWRDPKRTDGANAAGTKYDYDKDNKEQPRHRTRILYYRRLE